MAQYKVKRNQNIYDVAIGLYGSIEGIYDLMISNPGLEMSKDLKPGEILEYHTEFIINKGIVAEMKANGYIPANTERHVYPKTVSAPQIFLIVLSAEEDKSSIKIAGDGNIIFDWGDNSDLEPIQLTKDPVTVTHHYNNFSDDRIVRIYGDFNISLIDMSQMQGRHYVLRPVVVDEYIRRNHFDSLSGMELFEGMFRVDLTGSKISTLAPLNDMSLQELDLRECEFPYASVIDTYLRYIVSNYGTRRNCTVYLTTEPGPEGMAAIQTIINEPAWNESGKWVFNINGRIYSNDQNQNAF